MKMMLVLIMCTLPWSNSCGVLQGQCAVFDFVFNENLYKAVTSLKCTPRDGPSCLATGCITTENV